MGKRRKYTHHGSKRKEKIALSLDGTGSQSADFSLESGELVSISTDPCTATALTLNLGDLYDGASVIVDLDSNSACDTLTIKASCCQTILASGSFDDNARNHIRIDVFDSTKNAEVISVIYTTIA